MYNVLRCFCRPTDIILTAQFALLKGSFQALSHNIPTYEIAVVEKVSNLSS